jgi:excisionase family DNA binding protein
MAKQTNDGMISSRMVETVNRMIESISEIETSCESLSHRLEKVEEGGFGGKEVLTIDEAGFFLGYTRGYLYKLTQAASIPFHKPTGKTILFIRSELVEWVKSDGVIKGNAI